MRRPAALAAALLLSSAACGGDPERHATAALAHYFEAVQGGEPAAIAAMLEDCRAETLAERGDAAPSCELAIAESLASVAAQRELDEYRFDQPWGFGLVTALVLGRGGFWVIEELREVGEAGGARRFEAVLVVRTHYRPEETARLPAGAVIEYLVEPLGRAQRIPRRSRGPGALRRQLQELRLVAGLSLRDDGWRLVSLRPIPETAVYETVSWRPE